MIMMLAHSVPPEPDESGNARSVWSQGNLIYVPCPGGFLMIRSDQLTRPT